ncbi:MAG: flagellar basal body-associated FliL family protein [Treponema sp.]|jgi:flagellar basal body-associated protein FliL|nr:flagellar basal body-associated FliL family protein [Treponema sp.]
MVQKENKRSWILASLQRALFVCLLTLGVILVGGTVYSVVSGTSASGDLAAYRNAQALHGGAQGGGAYQQTFTGLGRLRIPTADPEPGMAILFVTFNFNPHDSAFTEELALRLGELREIIRVYIGSFPAVELQTQNEEVLRAELLRRMNAILRLGQIQTLFFSDFVVVG